MAIKAQKGYYTVKNPSKVVLPQTDPILKNRILPKKFVKERIFSLIELIESYETVTNVFFSPSNNLIHFFSDLLIKNQQRLSLAALSNSLFCRTESRSPRIVELNSVAHRIFKNTELMSRHVHQNSKNPVNCIRTLIINFAQTYILRQLSKTVSTSIKCIASN